VTNDIDQEEYKNRLAEVIGDFSAMLAQGVELTADDLVAGLSLDRNNSLVREWAAKNAGVNEEVSRADPLGGMVHAALKDLSFRIEIP
jgi:hypothetical protein